MLRRYQSALSSKNLFLATSSIVHSTIAVRNQSSPPATPTTTQSEFQSDVAAIFTAGGQHNINTKKRHRLDEYEAELHQQQKALDEAAEKRPNFLAKLTLVYLTGQTLILNYWVYSRFDWCLCEPITYLLGVAVTWIAIGYYLFTGAEYEWNILRGRMFRSQRATVYAKSNLDCDKIDQLTKEIGLLQEEIENASTPINLSNSTRKF